MLVQYIICNPQITSSWSQGAIIAQACHASVSAIVTFMGHADTKEYTSKQNLHSMTKIILKAISEDQFGETLKNLKNDNIDHHAWSEQPENIITCIATRPYEKDLLAPYFSGLKLYR